jgi:hypothetical protein
MVTPHKLVSSAVVVALVSLPCVALAQPKSHDKAAQAAPAAAPPDAKAAAPAAGGAAQPDAGQKMSDEKSAGVPATPEPDTEKQQKAPAPLGPRLHHHPVSVAPAHKPLVVRASIDNPQLVKQALLVYRIGADPALHQVKFRRGSEGPYVAIIPASDVRWPALSYTIEIEELDGSRQTVFASRPNMHRVEVPEDLMDVRERALSQRLENRRSVFKAGAEYVSFGQSDATETDPTTGITTPVQVKDYYYRIEGSYTYRPLRVVSEFSLRAGVVRGRSPVAIDTEANKGKSLSERSKVGLNYGAPTVQFRLADNWHLEGEFLTSVTEVGFSVGGGGALLIGDPYGSKLKLGFEAIQVFGTRFYSELDIRASDRVVIAPIVEVSDMPHADKYGVRLIGQIGVNLGQGFTVAARGGYQARKSTSGGPSGGGTLSYAF